MCDRLLTCYIQKLATKYPVVTLLGTRQSGKTTLVRKVFPKKPSINMEDADNRLLAIFGPISFLQSYPEGAIFDEVQRTQSFRTVQIKKI